MKKFILIDHEPWTLRRKQLFYDMFAKAGINLTVWDLSQWLYPGFTNPDTLSNEPYLSKVYSEKGFIELLRKENINEIIIVEEIFRIWENRIVFKILSQLEITTIKIELYGSSVFKETLLNKLKKLSFLQFPNVFRNKWFLLKFKIYCKWHKINKPLKVLSSNATRFRTDCLNHPDYDNYKFLPHIPIISGNYIVFCDIYFPFHTDALFLYKYKKTFSGEKYHYAMRSFFDFLEKKYNMPVVIAAHPKSDYNGNEFGNRQIVKYHTDDLVINASMVIMHLTAATSYAILADKPLAYIVTDDYLANPNIKHQLYRWVIGYWKLPFYNIDSTDYADKFQFEKITEELRKNYIYSYLTSEKTDNIPNHITLKNILSQL